MEFESYDLGLLNESCFEQQQYPSLLDDSFFNSISCMEEEESTISRTQSTKAIQERNRIAQRRFRERQKLKIHELQGQINDLEERVNQLLQQNGALKSHSTLLEKVLAMRDEHICHVQNEIDEQDSLNLLQVIRPVSEHDNEGLKSDKGGKGKLTEMTPNRVMQMWQNYVTEISTALVEASGLTTGDAYKKLEELVNEVNGVFMKLSVENSTVLKIWNAREYHMSEFDELEKWKTLIVSLELTDVQKSELTQLRQMLLEKLNGLVEDRKSLLSTAKCTLVTESVGHKLALEHLSNNEMIMKLKELLRFEDNAILQFNSTIVGKILNPIQVATLYVHGYPSRPDLLTFASAVAKELGQEITIMPENENQDSLSLSQILTPASVIIHEKTESSFLGLSDPVQHQSSRD
eukprot:g468.t1